MKYLLTACLALLLASPVLAERKYSQGEYEVHYSAFNASFLSPEVVHANGLVRSKQQGVVSISLLKTGQPRPALITGTLKNLLGQETPLSFRQIKEGSAVYYLSQFPISSQDVLSFTLSVQPLDSDPIAVQFSQEVFPEP